MGRALWEAVPVSTVIVVGGRTSLAFFHSCGSFGYTTMDDYITLTGKVGDGISINVLCTRIGTGNEC